MKSRCLLVISLLVIGCIVSTQGTAVEYAGDQYVYEGNSVTIECALKGQEPIVWSRNGLRLTGSYRINTNDLNTGFRQSKLSLTDVTPEQTGLYKCNPSSNNVFSLRVINVGEITYEGPNAVREGDITYIYCYLARQPQWTKDGVTHYPSFKGTTTKLGGGILAHVKIFGVRAKDAGVYRCMNSPKAHQLLVLNANAAIANYTNEVQLVPDEELFLPCQSSIYEEITAWYINGQKISDNKDGYVITPEQNGLLVHKAECKHVGTYTCTAKNTLVPELPPTMNKTMEVLPSATCGSCSIHFTTTSLLLLVVGWVGKMLLDM